MPSTRFVVQGLTAAVAVAIGVTLSACGSSNGTSAAPVPASTESSSAADTAAPAPVATEVNPPGDIPDNQAFVAYSPPAGGYTVKVPEGWSRTSTTQGASFTDKLNSIDVATTKASSAPTVASVTSTTVPALQSSSPHFTLGKVTTVTRTGGDAVLVTYEADSAVDPVTNKVVRDSVERYVFWKNGQEAVLTLTAPKGSDNVDPWRIVTDSFTWS